MLGSRTKQVYSYGKRNQRIVNVSDKEISSKDPLRIFDDSPPPTKRVSVVAQMRKRENSTPSKQIHVQRKRQSPLFSPPKRGSRVAQIIDGEVKKKRVASKLKDAIISAADHEPAQATVPRTPLATFSVNMVASPAVAVRQRGKSRVASNKRVPPKPANKPFSPFVDVDIIVLEDDGRTFSQERRVSRTDVEINPIQFHRTTPDKFADVGNSTDDESDDARNFRMRKRLVKARRVVYSDEEEDENSDVDVIPPPSPPIRRGQTSTSIPIDFNAFNYKPPARQDVPLRQNTPPPKRPILSYDPSPVFKARPLTPIRGGNQRHIIPETPTTPTDFDLSLDFTELGIGSPSQTPSRNIRQHYPSYLQPLLAECHQEDCGPHEFSAFVDFFPYDEVVTQSRTSDIKFRKIGEASYSEVFGIGDVVLKIIPLRDESANDMGSAGKFKMNAKYDTAGEELDGPAPSDAKDVRKEIVVTRAMGAVCDGFVELLKTYIVRGKYPEVLLKLWDEFNARKGSENVRPDTFGVSQVYAIIVLPNGGPDLEAFNFPNPTKTGWRQAASIFWQVAKTLAHAERLVSFEHRDLHWGQILVNNPSSGPVCSPLATKNQNAGLKRRRVRPFMDDATHGVVVTVIDLGLSRMDAGDGAGGEPVHWTPFEEEVFMGEGDYQFDIYRMMRDRNKGNWEEFEPATNVMWLHYLTTKLLRSKHLKAPTAPRKATQSQSHVEGNDTLLAGSTAAFTERECYESLIDVEKWLKTFIQSLKASKPKSGAKGKRGAISSAESIKRTLNPACAGEVVAYGIKKGWIQTMVG